MYGILFLAFQCCPLIQTGNITIKNFQKAHYIDHSFLFSLTLQTFKTQIRFDRFRCFQFSSALFASSRSNEILLTECLFAKMVNTPLYMNFEIPIYEKTESGQTFDGYDNIKNILFIDCSFIENTNIGSNYFMQVKEGNVKFDHCLFINSTNNNKQSFLLIKSGSNCIINNSQFSNNKLYDMIYSNELTSNISIYTTNFTHNLVTYVLHIEKSNSIFMQNLIIASNNANQMLFMLNTKSCFEDNNDCLMNDIKFISNTYTIDRIFFDMSLNLVYFKQEETIVFNRILISNNISSDSYYHFIFMKPNSTICLNNCCFSNPRDKVFMANPKSDRIYYEDSETDNEDCFDLNPKKIQYGIIRDEFVELEIPHRLNELFPD